MPSNRGYISGVRSESGLHGRIDYVDMSTKTAAKIAISLAVSKYQTSGVASTAKGYFIGGTSGVAISGVLFSDESAITVSAVLSTTTYTASGSSTSTKGYTFGGYTTTYINKIASFAFSSEAYTTLAATLTTTNRGTSALASLDNTYNVRGYNGSYITQANKFTHATETNAAISATANSSYTDTAYVSSNNFGYICGGNQYLPTANEKFNYATESFVPLGYKITAAAARTQATGGINNTTDGYICGGFNSSSRDFIEDIVFSNDTFVLLNARLSETIYAGAGVSPFCQTAISEGYYSAPATHAGYAIGGNDRNLWFTSIEKLNFSTDTYSKVAMQASAQSAYGVTTNSGAVGYHQQGTSYGNNAIDSIRFDNETVENHLAITQRRNYAGSWASQTKGYICGGHTGSVSTSTIDGITFSTNTYAVQSATLNIIMHASPTVSSYTSGYILGGYFNSARVGYIDRYNFSNDTMTTTHLGYTLPSRSSNPSLQSNNFGYVCGGQNVISTRSTLCDAFDFANEVPVNISAVLAVGQSFDVPCSGINGQTAGYLSGGVDSSDVGHRWVDKLDYSTQTFIYAAATMYSDRQYMCGTTTVQQTPITNSKYGDKSDYAFVTGTLISGNGVNNSTTITDATGKTITTSGNAKISTTQGKFSGGSVSFDGTNSYLTLPAHSDFVFRTNDFTIECWVYVTSAPSVNAFIYGYRTGSDSYPYLFIPANLSVSFGGDTTTWATTPANAITTGTWNHIAVVRKGCMPNNLTIYINGVSAATGHSITDFSYSANGPRVGASSGNNYWLNGYIQDLRVVNGKAIYSGNFTAPTSQLTTTSSNYVPTTVYQKGYIVAGCLNAADTFVETTDIVSYANNTIQSSEKLAQVKRLSCSVNTDNFGYTLGGYCGERITEIDKIRFDSDSIYGIATQLSAKRSQNMGSSSLTKGYSIGGHDGAATLTKIEAIVFNNETLMSVTAVLNTARYCAASLYNIDFAYMYCGYGISTVDKFTHSTETCALTGQTIITSRFYMASTGNNDKGFATGGEYSYGITEKLTFETGSCSLLSGYLTYRRGGSAGVSSSTTGYVCGGYDNGDSTGRKYNHRTVDEVNFSSDAVSLSANSLSAAKGYAVGVNTRVYGSLTASAAQVPQTTKGYLAVGYDGTDLYPINILQYSTETYSSNVLSLTYPKRDDGVANSSTKGYWFGGITGNTVQQKTDVVRFDNDSIHVSSTAIPSIAKRWSYGVQSLTNAYFCGGLDASSTSITAIDRLVFSTDTNTIIGASTTATNYMLPMIAYDKGYYYGGSSGSAINIFRAFSYSSESLSTLGLTLDQPDRLQTSAHSRNFGLLIGGTNGDRSLINQLTYNNGAIASINMALQIGVLQAMTMSFADRCYVCGGQAAMSTRSIDTTQKVDYTSLTSYVMDIKIAQPSFASQGTTTQTFGEAYDAATTPTANSTPKGYFTGGYSSIQTGLNEIDVANFVTSTMSLSAYTLLQKKYWGGSFNTNTIGYVGGSQGVSIANTVGVDAIRFDTEVFYRSNACLALARRNVAANASATKGYWFGGYTSSGSTEIDGMIFSSEASTNPAATLTANVDVVTAISSNYYCYVYGGYRSSYINKFIYLTETLSAITAVPLSAAVTAVASIESASSSAGYLFGGGAVNNHGNCSKNVSKFSFITEAVSLLVETLPVATSSMGSVSQSGISKGLIAGGYININTARTFDFDTETLALFGDSLSNRKHAVVGTSNSTDKVDVNGDGTKTLRAIHLTVPNTEYAKAFSDSGLNGKITYPVGDVRVTQKPAQTGGDQVITFCSAIGNYLSLADSGDFAFGTGDFTVEAWVNFAYNGSGCIFESRINSGSGGIVIGVNQTSRYVYANSSVTSIQSANNTVDSGINHIAVSRTNSVLTIFVNGVAVKNGASTDNFFNTRCHIGKTWDGSYLSGALRSLRVTKGLGRYTSDFTPTTVWNSSDANYNKVVLLINASSSLNNVIDSSSGNKAVTMNGGTIRQILAKPQGYVNYFDGNGDYISLSSTDFATGTSDFTIEMWINSYTLSYTQIYYASQGSTTSGQLTIAAETNGRLSASVYDGTTRQYASYFGMMPNTWYHVAVTSKNQVITLYVNGVACPQLNSNVSIAAADVRLGMNPAASGERLYGCIDGFVFTKEVALYSGNFTPVAPTSYALTYNDPHYNNVAVQLSGEGNAGSTNIIDTSLNAKAISPTGGTVSATQKKYGSTAISMTGTGSYLTLPTSNDFIFGMGDFTIEGWFYKLTAHNVAAFDYTDGSTGALALYVTAAGKLTIARQSVAGGTITLYDMSAVAANTWYHLAVVRQTFNLRVYLNGTLVASIYDGSDYSVQTTKLFGSADGSFNGYVDDFRITKNIARYKANFTPVQLGSVETAADYTDDMTEILNFDFEGLDGATTITDVGRSKITPTFVQFISDQTGKIMTTGAGTPTIDKVTSKFGGYSIYLNGSSYLSYAASTDFYFGTGDVTMEAWVYTADTQFMLVCNNISSGLGFGYNVDNGTQGLWFGKVGVGPDATSGISTTIPTNTWTHIAVCRSGTSVRFFINGTQVGTTATVSTSYVTGGGLFIGKDGVSALAAYYFTGYVQDLRVSRTARYTADFSVPTQPLTLDSYTYALPRSSLNDLTAISSTTSKSGSTSLRIANGYLTTQYIPKAYDWWEADYTVEAWINLSQYVSTYYTANTAMDWPVLIGNMDPVASAAIYWTFGTNGEGKLRFYYWTGSATNQVTATCGQIPLNTWTHVALTYTLATNTITLFVNQQVVASAVVSGTPSSNTSYPLTIGSIRSRTFNGFVDGLKITKGKVLYTPTTIYTDSDKLFYLDGETVGDNNTIVDSSANALTLTNTGNVGQGWGGPYSGFKTLYFTGADTCRLDIAANAAFGFGTADFTIECWVNVVSYTNFSSIVDFRTGATSTATYFELSSGGNLVLLDGPAGTQRTSAANVALNIWTHIAVVRNNNTIRFYINGALDVNTYSVTNTFGTSQPCRIASNQTASNFFKGMISNLHITKSAKYNASFIPTTSPIVADANTQLLLSGNNGKILDQYQKRPLQTFGVLAGGVSGRNGSGCLSFSGASTCYGVIPASSEFEFGSGDFTIEFWFNVTSGTEKVFFAGATNYWVQLDWNAALTSKVGMCVSSNGTSWDVVDSHSTSSNGIGVTSVTINTWHHLAMVRKANTFTLYLDGAVERVAVSNSSVVSRSTEAKTLGKNGNNTMMAGYIDDFRILKSAKYTGAFTPV